MKAVNPKFFKLLLILLTLSLYAFMSFPGLTQITRAKQQTTAKDCTTCDRDAQRNRPASPCAPNLSAQEAERIAKDTNRTKWTLTPCEAEIRSRGCNDCHSGVEDMHNGKISLGCIDCHGGDATVR